MDAPSIVATLLVVVITGIFLIVLDKERGKLKSKETEVADTAVSDMVRFEIEGDPIKIAYGADPISGVFLSVYDKRLKYDSNASDAVNAVTESIGVKDGGGSYFDLHTGSTGFRIKVDDKTMVTFLKRFGVSNKQIKKLPLRNT